MSKDIRGASDEGTVGLSDLISGMRGLLTPLPDPTEDPFSWDWRSGVLLLDGGVLGYAERSLGVASIALLGSNRIPAVIAISHSCFEESGLEIHG